MRSIWRTTDRDIVFACLGVAVFAVSYGAIAVSDGLPVWLPVVMSLTVIAGSSELLFVGIVASGGGPLAAALAGLLVNARHLPYSLALPHEILGRGWRRMLGTHLINDESVVFALARTETRAQRTAFWTCGIGVLITWPGGAVLGALLGSVVKDTSALGMDAVFPAVILALIMPALKEPAARLSVLAGAAIAVAAAPFLPAGAPVLVALAAAVPAVFRAGPAAVAPAVPAPASTPSAPAPASVPAGPAPAPRDREAAR
jgi:4-azaleucine resistance transporter AzlC